MDKLNHNHSNPEPSAAYLFPICHRSTGRNIDAAVIGEFFILTFRLVLQSKRQTQFVEYVALQHIMHFVKNAISVQQLNCEVGVNA